MERVIKLQQTLAERDIDCALLLYHRDVYYYAGTARPASLAVTPNNAVLFARRGALWIAGESRVEDIREGGLRSIFAWVRENGAHEGILGVEMDLVPANLFLRMREELPEVTFTDISPIVIDQRLVKDESEIAAIRGACRIIEQSHRHLPRILEAGASELELAAEVERIARLNGHESFAILRKRMETEMGAALVLAGESLNIIGGYGQVVTGGGLSTASPYGSSRRKIQAGDTVVFDIAGMNEGYHADMARTYCVGTAGEALREAHGALKEIQSAIMREAVPGKTAGDIYETAIERATALGWGDHFQGTVEQRGTFVGHGLGLEVDEPPLLAPHDETVLRENMTFTTEIFMVHPAFGEAKIEDTVRVTAGGAEFLTDLEREVIEV